ncbi:MAG TPA: SNF2-related protein [Myxococcaceae bacterium]|nr:SNF2-related protein [Myxococcaceae bacterium]
MSKTAAAAVAAPPADLPLTRFHERLLVEELSTRAGDGTTRLASALSEARVDLNPHQVEAAAFALDSLSRGGCMLADEVGLGKTIEAGIVLAQLLAEGKTRLLVLAPATLRAQWQQELRDKFDLDAVVVDGRTVRATGNPFDQPAVVIASHPFAASRAELLSQLRWDLVVIDEAHRLRNAYRPSHKTGRALKAGLKDSPKLLLTATPLQNDLLELFGLLSLLDEQILGPEHAFRARYEVDAEGILADSGTAELKGRLSGVVQRTLRRQVREYVRFTDRRSIVEDFAPSAEEQDLYEKVSEYLRRSESTALDPGKKTLLTLVYRKLLASSTYAIAPTLRKLAETLGKRLEAARRGAEAQGLLFAAEPEEARQFSEEAEEWTDEDGGKPRPGGLKALQDELWELERYAEQAEGISVNAKGEALKRALDRTFTVARAHQWPEKAVIFTESRRTQEYLLRLLTDHGFRGKISVLSGDAGTPEERARLVEEFRDRTQILLSTEAGAEGLNLQFCNLVVNYDLPWNPQRIEQRIGRCHRYGQQRDVLVLNFLNRRNAADARLYDLLEKKLNLFDGVFGASDEILGALESGVDFERRVLDIYQSCRQPEEIDRAFDALRADLEKRIDRRMTSARSLILEKFDGEVRRRLRLAGEQAQEVVQKRRQRARALTGSVLGTEPPAPDGPGAERRRLSRAAGQVRGRTVDAVSYLSLDAAALPARLSRLAGAEGWWFAYRVDLSGLKPEERLLHLVLVREGDRFRALPLQDADHFLRLPARDEPLRKPAPVSVTAAQEQALAQAREELARAAERRSALELDLGRERADRYAEDCLLEPREAVEKAHAEWEAARRTVAQQEEPAERVKARAFAERLERDYRRRLQALRMEEEKRYAQKDRSLAQLAQAAKVVEKRALIASAYFWLG